MRITKQMKHDWALKKDFIKRIFVLIDDAKFTKNTDAYSSYSGESYFVSADGLKIMIEHELMDVVEELYQAKQVEKEEKAFNKKYHITKYHHSNVRPKQVWWKELLGL